jgi:hypothetical protein
MSRTSRATALLPAAFSSSFAALKIGIAEANRSEAAEDSRHRGPLASAHALPRFFPARLLSAVRIWEMKMGVKFGSIWPNSAATGLWAKECLIG